MGCSPGMRESVRTRENTNPLFRASLLVQDFLKQIVFSCLDCETFARPKEICVLCFCSVNGSR